MSHEDLIKLMVKQLRLVSETDPWIASKPFLQEVGGCSFDFGQVQGRMQTLRIKRKQRVSPLMPQGLNRAYKMGYGDGGLPERLEGLLNSCIAAACVTLLEPVMLTTYERRRSQREVINEMPLYPTEGVLWDENQIPSVNYTGGCGCRCGWV
eukprot:1157388-Pelagomonas_calceolata.AAC.15